ncbi:MAG: DUF362 domain-containing protein [Chloroflexi bacterium]|nr:DUF362 domain-containing protein [Chloroflexota bacterium]MBU1751949.1 DUF362 domain-containing protein [Chloroflexota bacterium]MBU1879800.1 DUF362 domain-containing protein [Chloroflexota bacterium]
MNVRLSRRTLLRLGLVGGILLGLEFVRRQTEPVGLDNWLRWNLRGRTAWLLGQSTPVAVTACPTYQDVTASLTDACDLLRDELPPIQGRTVVIKTNLVDVLPDRPTCTNPAVIEALVAWCQASGARRVVVADGSAFQRDAEALVEASGLGAVLRRRDVTFVDLNLDELVRTPLPGHYTPLGQLLLPRTVVEADLLISAPKMKCHHWTGVSLSIKNLVGVVPGAKYGWPKNIVHLHNIHLSVLDLYEALRPGLAVVDGVVGLEGDGPLMGTARPTGVLVMGVDGVAVDAVSTRIMGLDPALIPHLYLADWTGLGALEARRIDVRGLPIDRVRQPYEPPPNMRELGAAAAALTNLRLARHIRGT